MERVSLGMGLGRIERVGGGEWTIRDDSDKVYLV